MWYRILDVSIGKIRVSVVSVLIVCSAGLKMIVNVIIGIYIIRSIFHLFFLLNMKNRIIDEMMKNW